MIHHPSDRVEARPFRSPTYGQVSLPRGWHGTVLTDWNDARPTPPTQSPSAASPPPLPTLDTPSWERFLAAMIGDSSELPDSETLKCSAGGGILMASLQGEGSTLAVVCRHARSVGVRNRVVALFRPSGLRRQFRVAQALLRAGVETARPLALVERSFPHCDGWLVTEAITEAVDLDQLALSILPSLDRQSRCRVKRALAARLAELFADLGSHGIFHRDLKASNILIRHWAADGASLAVCLIDLEGVRVNPGRARRERWRPMARLAASLLEYSSIGRSDFARFLRLYLSKTESADGEWRVRFRALADQANQYRQRARRRKTGKLDGFDGA